MTTWEAIFLGIIQGITEFLPISSSGHLKLTQYLFGFKDLDNYLLFDLVCHVGTLAAICVFFFSQLKLVLRYDRKRVLQVVIATLPLIPCILILKPIKHIMNQPEMLGYFFLLTAALLFASIKAPGLLAKRESKFRDAGLIGLFQTLALLPGVSRSGSTISAARLVGWKMEDAILFSFLIAIPAILGSVALITLETLTDPLPTATLHITTAQYAAGFITSFLMGCVALSWLVRLAARDKLSIFVWYCLAVGLFTLAYTR